MSDLPKSEPKPSEKFKAAMKQILSMPKAEIDRREVEYQKERTERKRVSNGQPPADPRNRV